MVIEYTPVLVSYHERTDKEILALGDAVDSLAIGRRPATLAPSSIGPISGALKANFCAKRQSTEIGAGSERGCSCPMSGSPSHSPGASGLAEEPG